MARRLPSFRLEDFVGGVNRVSAPPKVRQNELIDALNVDLRTDGGLASRLGTTLQRRYTPLKTSLVSWWRFNENGDPDLYDRAYWWNDLTLGAGSSLRDTTGTLFEGASRLTADGTGYYQKATPRGIPWTSGNGDFSVNFWVRSDGTTVQNTVLTFEDATPTRGLRIHISNTGLVQVRFYNPGANVFVNSVATVDGGSWTHVCVTYDGSAGAITIYINGVSNATGSAATTTGGDISDETLYVMCDRGGSGIAGEIEIDDLSIWNEIVSSPASLYNLGVAGGTLSEATDTPTNTNWLALRQFKPDVGTDRLVGVCGGQMSAERPEITSESPAPMVPIALPTDYATANLSLADRGSMVQLFSNLYWGNGSDANLRLESDMTLWQQGLPDPDTNIIASGVLSFVAGGNIDGASTDYFSYVLLAVRQVNGARTIVSQPADLGDQIQHTASSGNDTIRIASFPAAIQEGQTHWGLYRIKVPTATTARPLSDFYFVADVEIGTTNYDDDNAQETLVATGDAAGDYIEHRQPPATAYMAVTTVANSEILCMSGDAANESIVYVTSPIQGPDVYKAIAGVLKVGQDDGDPVTGLAAWYETLVFFKEDLIQVCQPNFDGSEFPYNVREGYRGVGCISHHTIQQTYDSLMWASDRGFEEVRSVDSLIGQTAITTVSRRIEPELESLQGDKRKDWFSVYLRRPNQNAYRVAVTESGVALPSTVWCYYLDHRTPDPRTNEMVGAWLKWSGFTYTAFAVREDDTEFLNEAWFGDNNGDIYQMDVGETDNGTNIQTLAYMPFVQIGETGSDTTRVQAITLEGRTSLAALNMEWNTNWGQNQGGSKAILLETEEDAGGDWDVAEWDIDDWGTRATTRPLVSGRVRVGKATGHRLQLRFSSNGGSWALYGIEIEGLPLGSNRVLKV